MSWLNSVQLALNKVLITVLIIFTLFFTIKLHDKLRLEHYSITVTGIENAPKQSIENNFQKNAN